MEPMPLSFTGVIHFPRLKDRLATHFVPFAEFEQDAAAGTLPDFSLIEPNMSAGHGDYHPAMGRSFSDQVEHRGRQPVVDAGAAKPSWSGCSTPTAPPPRRRARTSGTPPLLIGWDEPGGTFDHVPPGTGPAAGSIGARGFDSRRLHSRSKSAARLVPQHDDFDRIDF